MVLASKACSTSLAEESANESDQKPTTKRRTRSGPRFAIIATSTVKHDPCTASRLSIPISQPNSCRWYAVCVQPRAKVPNPSDAELWHFSRYNPISPQHAELRRLNPES